MSLNKINKELKKLYRLYKNTDISRETIIFSDSKGFSLRDVLNDRLKQKITVIAKSGANIYNNAQYYNLKNAVKKAKNPVVIVWLVTFVRVYSLKFYICLMQIQFFGRDSS
jgi:CRISPR/Cas system CMR subunit Cmr4 (Cas7 group RAMP superfamily)